MGPVFVTGENMYIIYGKQHCPFCDKAYDLLADKVALIYYEVGRDITKEGLVALMSKLTDKPITTVPQILKFENEKYTYIGGYEDLVKEFEA